MRVAIIPARGGSKRIPDKNTRDFLGVKIIGRVIKMLEEVNLFDRIIVSTDSDEIALVAREFGAEVPFIRPSNLADDFSGTSEVITHAIATLGLQNDPETQVCCVYPTSVLMTAKDLLYSIELFRSEKWKFVFAASRPNSSPLRSFKKADSGGLEMLFPHYWTTRSQDLPICFVDAGFFYWGTTETWMKAEPIFDSRSTFVEIPECRAIDINTEADWLQAESVFELMADGRIG